MYLDHIVPFRLIQSVYRLRNITGKTYTKLGDGTTPFIEMSIKKISKTFPTFAGHVS